MTYTARWLMIALIVSCCGLLNAAPTGTEVETLSLDGSPLRTDLDSISKLRLHLHDGDYRVVGSDSDDIVIRADGENRAQAGKMEVHLTRSGDTLDIAFSHVPKNKFQVTIEVPRETSLYARMRAGDLAVREVRGDKDLELVGGDLSIQVPDPDDYGPVDLSVRLGDVSGSQFGTPKGTIGNSLKRDGNGKYRLHAHVFAGDLTLEP